MTDNNTKITPAARRLIFNDRVYGTILEEVTRQTIGCLKTVDVKTKFKMYSRKIQLHRCGRDVMFYIAREGHTTIELMELLGNNVNTHVEFKVNELIRLSMGLVLHKGCGLNIM